MPARQSPQPDYEILEFSTKNWKCQAHNDIKQSGEASNQLDSNLIVQQEARFEVNRQMPRVTQSKSPKHCRNAADHVDVHE